MTDFIIVTDEQDASLGAFFKVCKDNIKSIFQDQIFIFHEIDSTKLKNDIYITQKIKGFTNPFVFVAFTHGSKDARSLIGNQDAPYISLGINHNIFPDSFVYCFSCHIGNTLGKEIVNSGARCFVGHGKTVFTNIYPKWQKLFLKPINTFCLRLKENNTINTCLKLKKEAYTSIIDDIYATDYFTASHLLENRDGLVLYGDGDCTITDFNH
ncbi:hypothetical protein FACS1894147_02310 [Spirochaetia bacterium]|nr:hypothetical protein FACS1894147_02310 [Spirochaetia bacterium]